jgi:hypothetical protein
MRRSFVGHVPNVGLGNQLIAIVGYLAHALLSGRALFLQTATLQCDTTQAGEHGVGSTTLSPLCNVFAMRHEGTGGRAPAAATKATDMGRTRHKPIWHWASVIERSRALGRLERLHAAYPKGLSMTTRATPGRQHSFDHIACAADNEGGPIHRLLTHKTLLHGAAAGEHGVRRRGRPLVFAPHGWAAG